MGMTGERPGHLPGWSACLKLEQYTAAVEEQRNLARSLDEFFAQCVVVLTLSPGGEVPRWAGANRPDLCLIWALCGVPAINFSVFRGPCDLPFGVRIVGRRYNDFLLLSFSKFLRSKNVISDVSRMLKGSRRNGGTMLQVNRSGRCLGI